MDEKNIHTSVVIELADQEEPEDQKTYRIDIDDVDSPKDYVIDQIFCGENVTVYALFEVPEGSKISDNGLVDVPSSSLQENYKFFHKNSYKEVINKKKMYGYKHNSYAIRSEEDLKFLSERHQRNESLYCLKHLGGDYRMLTPERNNSDLKVLYSKETVSKSVKLKTSKGLKFMSKGVNTDIVQSPKIIEEVQRTVGVNIPFAKNKEKNVEDSCSSLSKSSYEVIEMEMRQSYSSVNSDSVSGKCKKSVPNFFIVPLLMMEDGTLSHYEKTDKSQRLKEEKHLCSKKMITSLGVNTDLSFDSIKKTDQDSNEISPSESYKTDSDNYDDQNLYEKKETSIDRLKINSKETIINEIKIMQRTLNVLIKSIESNDFIYNAREKESDVRTSNDGNDHLERMSESLLNETGQKKYQKLDERPIFLPFRYPSYPNKLRSKAKKRTQTTNESKKNESAPKKSVSNDFLPNSASSESMVVRRDPQAAKDEETKSVCDSQINCLEAIQLKNRKTFRSSKSESCVRVILPFPKQNSNNSLKKSQSFDLKCDKVEALKKTKNLSYKVENNIKTKTNVRIYQNKEGPQRDNLCLMKCEMGDDVDKKPVNINEEVLNITQKPEKAEKLENSGLEEIIADKKKNFYEEEGDAKLAYPKETLVNSNAEKVQVSYHNANVIPSESSLKSKKSISPRSAISKTVEVGTKISSDAEKPITPNKCSRKMNISDSNPKKDIKINKKINNKIKIVEKVNKSEGKDFSQTETDKKKTLTGSRKSIRHNGDSKLHIDKLIKLNNTGNNHRALPSVKNNQDEKAGVKSERVSCTTPQKQGLSEHPIDLFFDENIKEESKMAEEKSTSLVRVESFHKSNEEKEEPLCHESKEKMPEEVNLNLMRENYVPLSSNPSSVVVELFSKKPKSVNEFCYEVDQENLEKTPNRENMIIEKNGPEKEKSENSESLEKPVVKSVWALTKVLLYEDGTNKLEVLEASLTPPNYSLN